jgi:FkbM family methyltransferase
MAIRNNYDLTKLEKITTARFGFDLYTTPEYAWKYTEIVFEEMTALLIRQMVKGVKTFIDIGAHYGFYSVLAGLSNPDLEIIAFEPIPENYEILEKNLALNDVYARTFQVALSDFAGKSKFQVSEQTSQSGFTANPDESILKEIEVNVDRLNHYADSIQAGPVIIKMDTEGHELRVLNGMQDLIEKIPDIRLFIEFNPNCLAANDYDPQGFLESIIKLGFDIFVIGDTEMRYEKFDASIDYQAIMGERTYRNLYCVRSEQSLNLCIFSHSSQMAGAERSLLSLVSELTADYGANCSVLLPFDGPMVRLLQDAGAASTVVPYTWWCPNWVVSPEEATQSLGEGYAAVQKISAEIVALNPDVIMTNTMAIPWGAIYAQEHGLPHLWMVNEFGELDQNLHFFFPFESVIGFIEKYSDKIVTVSNAVKNELFGNREDISTIYRSFSQIKESLPESEDRAPVFDLKDAFKLILPGTISEGKGQLDAVKAAIELVNNRDHNVELNLVGKASPDYQREIEGIIENADAEAYIRILPFTEDIYPVMNAADAVLVCSRMEAFGRVTVEAMLLNKPVIGTNTGGTMELIEEGRTGLTYEPGNAHQLANQIEKLIQDPVLRRTLAENGNKFANENFSKEKFSGAYYQELMRFKSSKAITQERDESLTIEKFYRRLLSNRKHFLQSLEIELQELKIEKAQLEQQVLFFARSKSWRITKPFRKVMALLRRIRRE